MLYQKRINLNTECKYTRPERTYTIPWGNGIHIIIEIFVCFISHTYTCYRRNPIASKLYTRLQQPSFNSNGVKMTQTIKIKISDVLYLPCRWKGILSEVKHSSEKNIFYRNRHRFSHYCWKSQFHTFVRD